MSKISLSGLNTRNHCGYCKSHGSSSYGFTCNLMRSSDYESLMLKGWRRCGSYYYKPDVPNSCCRLNTIRCDAASFSLNKSQRKVQNRFERFVSGKKSESDKKKAKRTGNKLQVPEALTAIIKLALQESIQGLCEFKEDFVKIVKNLPSRVA